ncbi:MAG: 5'/3'-nucleotidase SurE [Caldilineaceae bacterium]|nr:5'/3'-nucleotidase SurE [Caldilineaceae bacterium]
MPTILVTNDDGVYSPGLLALTQRLRNIGRVMVLAPERNWSASSHAKTMQQPVRVHPVVLQDGSEAFATTGSPTDCVALAAAGVLDAVPDLVVSGINAGHNMGIDISYSGTVACAKEAAVKRIPGIAMSTVHPLEVDFDIRVLLEKTAEIAARISRVVLARGLPPDTLLNVNVPGAEPDAIKGMHITRMGHRRYDADEVIERTDPYGVPYYWLGGSRPQDVLDDGTDVGAVANGYVSVTPITLDMTAYGFLDALREWKLE